MMRLLSVKYLKKVLAILSVSIFFLLIGLTGCRSERKLPGIIPSDKMELILYDYHCAQSMAEIAGDSAEYRRFLYIHSVFQKYGVTEAQFDSSMIWYSADAALLEQMYQHINERMEREMGEYAALLNGQDDYYGALSVTGDTANIWRGRNFYFLRAGSLNNRMMFTIQADTTFEIGDSILWQFEPLYIVQDKSGREVYSGLSVHYADTVVSVVKRFTSDERVDLYLKPVQGERIEKIAGFVYYATSQSDDLEKFRALVLKNIHLVRFHKPQIVGDTLIVDSVLLPDSISVDSLLVRGDSIMQDTANLIKRHSTPADFKRKRK